MSPGTVLAEARRQAGLTVAEVSQQTRIRESIIRGIEQDDYSACGGDFYARGHIRAMARAVGTDPAPLIEEYDAAQGPPEVIGAGPGGPFQEPDEPGLTGGWRAETEAFGPGSVPPPPAELGLPYQPGGFRPLPADPVPHRDTGVAPRAPGQRIPPYDTGNVRPIPADPGPPEDSPIPADPGPPEDNGAGQRSFPARGTAPGGGPGHRGHTSSRTPAGTAPTYTFTDPSARPDPEPDHHSSPTPPSTHTDTKPTRHTFTDPSAAPDPEPDHPGPTPPSPPTDSASTLYTFTDPSATPDPDQEQDHPGPPADAAPARYSFAGQDEPLGSGPGHHIFSDFADLDAESDSEPGGRFFSEPGAADDAETEWDGPDAGQPRWDESGAGHSGWNASDTGQPEWRQQGTGQAGWDNSGTGQPEWDEPHTGQFAWDESGAAQTEWGEPGTGQPEWDEPHTGQFAWDESGAGQPEPTGLDALFGGTSPEPPPGGTVTEPGGYSHEPGGYPGGPGGYPGQPGRYPGGAGGYPGGAAAGTWPARPAPGGQPATPPPTSPPPRPGRRPGAARPAGPAAGRTAGQRRPNRTVIILIGLLVVIGVLSYVLLSGSGPAPQQRPAAASSSHASPSASHPTPTPTPTPSSSPPPSPPATQVLHPVGAAAFGPGGLGDGDNPQYAALAIDPRIRTAWQSDWYTTSQFGNLKSGTGLLLNMGGPVTVSSVLVNLGATQGASLQIRAGSSPAPGSMRTVARAANAGGTVRLRMSSPAHARYLVIWFSTLPQDPAGTFEAKIYNIRVRGTH